jgi:hypothetical protein
MTAMLAVAMFTAQTTFAGSCTMSNNMTTAAQSEQTRRQNDLDIRTQQLQLLNDLQRACLENFPEYPTAFLGNDAIMTTAFNKVKAASCNGLTAEARNTSNSAINAARQAAQNQINAVEQSIVSTNPTLLNPVANGVNNVANSTLSSTPSSLSNSVLSSITRLFQ